LLVPVVGWTLQARSYKLVAAVARGYNSGGDPCKIEDGNGNWKLHGARRKRPAHCTLHTAPCTLHTLLALLTAILVLDAVLRLRVLELGALVLHQVFQVIRDGLAHVVELLHSGAPEAWKAGEEDVWLWVQTRTCVGVRVRVSARCGHVPILLSARMRVRTCTHASACAGVHMCVCACEPSGYQCAPVYFGGSVLICVLAIAT